MCVERISNNVFPCNTTCYSFASTTVLITALASTILAGSAFYLQWGTVYVAALSAGGCATLLLATALICCKKPAKSVDESEALPLPSDKGFVAAPSEKASLTRSKKLQIAGEQLLEMVREGSLENFREGLALYQEEDFKTICLSNLTHFLEQDEGSDVETRIGYNVVQAILLRDDFPEKMEFLRAVLDVFKAHSVEECQTECIDALAKIQDAEMLSFLVEKLDSATLLKIVESSLDSRKPNHSLWIKTLLEVSKKDVFYTYISSYESLIKRVIASRLDAHEKNVWIVALAQANESTLLENVKIDRKHATPPLYACSVLMLAILEEDAELVQILAGSEALVNQPALVSNQFPISPLLLAVHLGNYEIVQSLLESGDDPNFTFVCNSGEILNTIFPQRRKECTQATPLMLSAASGKTEISAGLLKKGARFDITDTGDAKGKTAVDYQRSLNG